MTPATAASSPPTFLARSTPRLAALDDEVVLELDVDVPVAEELPEDVFVPVVVALAAVDVAADTATAVVELGYWLLRAQYWLSWAW